LADEAAARRLGGFMEPAMWTMLALRDGPQPLTRLFDRARSLDGPIGHGTLLAALARLERLGLVAQTTDAGREPAYLLTTLGTAAAGTTLALS
jgi:DNA-binding HxlR family transcriptional regulator